LVRGLTPLLLLGLLQGLRWLCNHLEYNLLRRGCYTCAYAYDMRNAGMIYKINKRTITNTISN
jgi:hypothetical protein